MKRSDMMIVFNSGLPKSNFELEKIKKEFLLNDVKHKDILNSGGIPVVNLSGSKIMTEVVSEKSKRIGKDEFGIEEEVVEFVHEISEIDFNEEFKNELDRRMNRFLSNFISLLNEKDIYTKEKLEGFKKLKLKKINKLIDFYTSQSDLPSEFKDLIIKYFNKGYDKVSSFNLEEIQISDKLKFKLNRNQLIVLFQTMFDKEVISGMSQLDLYRILDEKTMYTNDVGVYSDMKSTRIQANKLQKGNTSSNPSIEKLSQLFDKNFFSSTL